MSKHELIVVAGPRAIGKSFWTDQIILWHNRLPETAEYRILQRVRTTTTRARRGSEAEDAYHFVSEEEFQRRLDAGDFLEHDDYRGCRYGSTLASIESTLGRGHGIIVLTPPGVAAVWELRDRFPVRVVRLAPAHDVVVALNLDRRGIMDAGLRASLISHAMSFDLMPQVPAQVVAVSGDRAVDWPVIQAVLSPR
jgi:guanylate kinase